MLEFQSSDLEILENSDSLPKNLCAIISRIYYTARVAHIGGDEDKGRRAYELAKKLKAQGRAAGIRTKSNRINPYTYQGLEALRTSAPSTNGKRKIRKRLRKTIATNAKLAEWASILLKKFS